MSKLIHVEIKSGGATVVFKDGAKRPYQVFVKPSLTDDVESWDAPARFVSGKTLDAAIARLNRAVDDTDERVSIATA